MNRAFLIVTAPAVLVLAFFGAILWGYRVPLPAAAALLGVAVIVVFFRRRRRRTQVGG